MPQQTNRTGLRSGPALLSEAWSIYRGRWKTYARVSLLPIIVLFITAVLTAGSALFGQTTASLLFFLLLAVSILFLFPWAQVALTTLAINREKSLTGGDAFRQTVSKILPFLWITFLSSLIISGGFVLFVIPGLMFSIWFGFAAVILIAENMGGMNALLKSREYVKGFWWPVLWRILFLALVGAIAALPIFILQVIFGEPSTSLAVTNTGGPTWLDIVSSLYNSLTYIVLLPVSAIYTVLMYENLRGIKGQFSFAPSTGRKAMFVGIGIFGILLGIALILGSIGMIASFSLNQAISPTRNTTTQQSSQARPASQPAPQPEKPQAMVRYEGKISNPAYVGLKNEIILVIANDSDTDIPDLILSAPLSQFGDYPIVGSDVPYNTADSDIERELHFGPLSAQKVKTFTLYFTPAKRGEDSIHFDIKSNDVDLVDAPGAASLWPSVYFTVRVP